MRTAQQHDSLGRFAPKHETHHELIRALTKRKPISPSVAAVAGLTPSTTTPEVAPTRAQPTPGLR